MQMLLTPALLKLLKSLGYCFCLFQVTLVSEESSELFITLVPLKSQPDMIIHAEKYDGYFQLDKEPVQLAHGINGVTVLIELTEIKGLFHW